MKRKLRLILFLLLFWSAIIGVPGFLLWHSIHQQDLNRDLVAAIRWGNVHAALLALSHGADANARNEPSIPLRQRIWDLFRGHRSGLSDAATPLLLLQDGAVRRPIAIRPTDTPELTRALLLHGVRVDVTDEFGRTPLFFAIVENERASARILVEHGAKLSAGPGHSNLLTVAIDEGYDPTFVELMLQHGADSNHADENRQTPLGAALQRGDQGLVQCLLRYHADPNAVTKVFAHEYGVDMAGRPLKIAERHHMTAIVRMLKDAGAKSPTRE